MQAYKFLKKETPTQVFPCEFCKIFKNIFLASGCFSKSASLFMIAVVRSCLSKLAENIHICIRLQLPLSYKFRNTKDWLNQHNGYNKVPQDIKYKLTGLCLSKFFVSGLICWGGVYFRESFFREYKNKLDKSEKVERIWKDSNLKDFM